MERNIYTFQTARRIYAGPGSTGKIAEIIKDYGTDKVLVITDKNISKAGIVDMPCSEMKKAGIDVRVIDDVKSEPEMAHVEDIFEKIGRTGFRMLVGIGGGSVLDLTKVISVLMTNNNSIDELIGNEKIANNGIPTLMIPTTSGTGSEVTQNAILTIDKKGRKEKAAITSSKLIPERVIIDPVMTLSLPPSITALTGIDAFSHLLECFISKKSNPVSDSLALKGMKMICGNITKVCKNGSDIDARHNMAIGSMFGGMCIASSGTAAAHALSYPLSGRFHISHAAAITKVLPHVIEFNRDAIGHKLCEIAEEIGLGRYGELDGFKTGGGTGDGNIGESLIIDENKADRTIAYICSLIKNLNIYIDLKSYGITENDIGILTDDAAEITRLLQNNPKPLSKEDIRDIYRKCIAGDCKAADQY